jgi:activator of 2-hydroxyglutaryl-CoA dehydratase
MTTTRVVAATAAAAAVGSFSLGWLLARRRFQAQIDEATTTRDGAALFLGVDLGGTTISVAVCDDDGQVLGHGSVEIGSALEGRTPDAIVSAASRLARRVRAASV